MQLAPPGGMSSHCADAAARTGHSEVILSGHPLPETAMLHQILTHTPTYVWAILALLIWRGASALRERELEARTLFVMPLAMLGLSLQDIAGKFGGNGIAFAAWAVTAAATALLVLNASRNRLACSSTPGSVRVAGSWLPLALMMAVFLTKYAASVLLAVQPHLRQDPLAVAGICALFGLLNGCFLGRLARDLVSLRGLQTQREPQAATLSA
jgi:hypothetical protein